MDALDDLTTDVRRSGIKPSPLTKRFLTGISKSTFYKSYPPGTYEDIKQGMNYNDVNPYESEAIFKVETLPKEAKAIIFQILGQIADVIISDVGKQNKKLDQDYGADYNYVSKNIIPILKSNQQTFIELMYDLLSFGDMVQVYTVMWEVENEKGNITKRSIGSPVMYKKDKNGNETPLPNVNGDLPNESNTTMIWSSGQISEEQVKEHFLNKFLARANEKRQAGEQTRENDMIILFQQNSKEAIGIITAIRNGLNKFFGFEGLNVPVLKKNRDKLNQIINNYYASMLAEAKKSVKAYILNFLKK